MAAQLAQVPLFLQDLLQAFEQAIPPVGLSKSEGQIALDLLALASGVKAQIRTEERVINPSKLGQVPGSTEVATPMRDWFNAASVRQEMASKVGGALSAMATDVQMPAPEVAQQADMEMVEV